jgi:hypothetical protein
MKAAVPFLSWIVFLAAVGPAFLQAHWESALIVFAVLLLVPPALALLDRPGSTEALLPGILLAAAYWFYPSPAGAALALPYVGWVAYRTFATARETSWTLTGLCRLVAHVYWLVGAFWVLAFLASYGPLGFDPTITHLTGAHFHVAGLVLTTIVVCMLERWPNASTRALGAATVLGMPAVALGIVLTHFGFPPVYETLSGTLFATMALAVAVVHLRVALHPGPYRAPAKVFWLISALCLLAGAVLAALYALRPYVPLAFVTLPNMKLWHGTLNTLGFGWFGLWGWMWEKIVRN